MTAKDKIETGIRQVLKSDRELGRILRGVEVVTDPKCGCLEITPDKLLYNPAYIARNSQGRVTWLLTHEAMHLKLRHTERFTPVFKVFSYEGLVELCRIATDLEVNHMIQDKKHMPSDAWVAGRGQLKELPPKETAEQYLMLFIASELQHIVQMTKKKLLRTRAAK